MSAEEIALAALLNPGVYPFEIMAATDEISKAGNEMIKVKLNVFGPDGASVHVYDYLMEKMAYKLRHCAEVCGLLARYETGEVEAIDFVGRAGFVKLDVDQGGNGYLPKNVVKDYVQQGAAPAASPPAQAGMPRKLTPTEFGQKHGLDPNAVLDDDLDVPF